MGNRNNERKADTPRELDRDFTGDAVNARSGELKQGLHEQAERLDDALAEPGRDKGDTRR